MSEYEVVVAGYPPGGAAKEDFDELVRRINAKEVRSEGVILVEKQADGEVVVTQTGDHMGRKGMGWGGGVGVLVGLAAAQCWPPSPSRRSRGWSAFVTQARAGLEDGLGANLKPGWPPLPSPTPDRLAAEQALDARHKSVAPMEGTGLNDSRTVWPGQWASSSPIAWCCPSPIAPSGARSGAP
jgi:arylsulfatase